MERAAKRRTVPRQMPSPQVLRLLTPLTVECALPPPVIHVRRRDEEYFSKEPSTGNIRTSLSVVSEDQRIIFGDSLGILQGYSCEIISQSISVKRNFAYSLEARIFTRFISYHCSRHAAETEQYLQQHLDILRRSTGMTKQSRFRLFYSPPETTILSSILQQWELLYSRSIVRIFFLTIHNGSHTCLAAFPTPRLAYSVFCEIFYRDAITRSYSW